MENETANVQPVCPEIETIPNKNLAYLETLVDRNGDRHHFCQHCGKAIFTVRGPGGNWTDEGAGVFWDAYELCGDCGHRFFPEDYDRD
jgi:hypothetical protein